MNFGDDYIDVSVDDDENGSDNLDQGRRNHQWSLSCCLCPCHGDGWTSVQVLIMITMTHFWHFDTFDTFAMEMVGPQYRSWSLLSLFNLSSF